MTSLTSASLPLFRSSTLVLVLLCLSPSATLFFQPPSSFRISPSVPSSVCVSVERPLPPGRFNGEDDEWSFVLRRRLSGPQRRSPVFFSPAASSSFACPAALFSPPSFLPPGRDRKPCDGSTDPNKKPPWGRPMGLKFDSKTCNLYIADAYFGLLMVGPSGGVAKQLAISAYDGGAPFKFLNELAVDSLTGVIYFTEGDKTQSLLKYDPKTEKVEILLQGLAFANGVALNKDGSFRLVAETSSGKINKFRLKGSKTYPSELFTQLKRPPDNIKRNKNGDFWVGLNSNKTSS
ncbi:protein STRICTOSIDINE SYNTHASE-LIKE 10-like [Neltuma alba]|uniref:protein STRICTOSIDINE SYNTHASE-LIKE 10-like n=1 Tax=Neltuma alba TaxID=207710 RepID=UPI0010A514E0|nr:protein STRICTOSIDINE SYNTHASE-LIKE 10-like [Prosopis alba]